jgi:hypothetical protein
MIISNKGGTSCIKDTSRWWVAIACWRADEDADGYKVAELYSIIDSSKEAGMLRSPL